jgi:hypothetical protein
MKCIHCGWDNHEQDTTCIKCGAAVQASPTIVSREPVVTGSAPTIVSRAPDGRNATPTIVSAPPRASQAETIDPHRQGGTPSAQFYLTEWAQNPQRTDDPAHHRFAANDNPVVLNRDNLDPSNTTLTRKVQAEVTLVDGKWFVQDQSEKETTFIQVRRPHELMEGDILLMGNRKFIFTTNPPLS